jgi:CRP-like cAMP-binding protein
MKENSKDFAQVLSHSTLFADLDRQGRQQIAKRMHVRTYSTGEIVVLTGDRCRVVRLIAEGRVRLQRLSSEGRKYVLRTIGSGQSFGLASALDGGYARATASALTQTVLYEIPVDIFHQVVQDHPQVSLALLDHLANRVRQLCDTVEELAFYTVRTRLARLLLSRANGDAPIARYTSQAELAAWIGTVRTVVGRTLRSFDQGGLIRRERGWVVITDREGLRREALRNQKPQRVESEQKDDLVRVQAPRVREGIQG